MYASDPTAPVIFGKPSSYFPALNAFAAPPSHLKKSPAKFEDIFVHVVFSNSSFGFLQFGNCTYVQPIG